MNRHREGGIVLLALLLVIAGIGMVAIAAAESTSDELLGARRSVAEGRVAAIAMDARDAWQRNGTLPADLGALAGTCITDPYGRWRFDPFGRGGDLMYRINSNPTGVTVTSCGPDGIAGTADDISFTADLEPGARQHTRGRACALRALYATSRYCDDKRMKGDDRAKLRKAIRSYGAAQRRTRYEEDDDEGDDDDHKGEDDQHHGKKNGRKHESERAEAEDAIESVRKSNGLPELPQRATGPGGLCERLGVPDSRGIDGFGNPFDVVPAGFRSRGADGKGGTSDDQ
ncbi:MAG: hypothetical protein HZB39_06385 [Planctomycetes bacterium]|nr:hypothetical protein [Planctomycetota bacterium]